MYVLMMIISTLRVAKSVSSKNRSKCPVIRSYISNVLLINLKIKLLFVKSMMNFSKSVSL